MQELTIIGFGSHPDIKEVEKRIKNAKADSSRIVLLFSFLVLILCLYGFFIQPNIILKSVSIVVGLADIIVFINAFIYSTIQFLAQKFIQSEDRYRKYCLQLYQLIVIINKQITSYNLALRSFTRGRTEHAPYDENLHRIYKRLLKKTENIYAILQSLSDIERTIREQESSALISELSHLSIQEVDQANPLSMGPITLEGLQEEIRREQEILQNFQELEQNQ